MDGGRSAAPRSARGGLSAMPQSAPRPPSAPTQSQAPAVNAQRHQQTSAPDMIDPDGINLEDALVDYTKVPKEMDQLFEELDEDGTLRPTIITTGDVWSKKAQKALLGKAEISSLQADEQR